MTAKYDWIVFYIDGKEVCRYTVNGSFAGELQATRECLAYEHGREPKDVKINVILANR